jgi:hypothetical protein
MNGMFRSEQVLRLFDAPSTFIDTLRHTAGAAAALDPAAASRASFASLPALGLSNKPMAQAVEPSPAPEGEGGAGGFASGPVGVGEGSGGQLGGDGARGGAAPGEDGGGGDKDEIEALMEGYGGGVGGEDEVRVAPRALSSAPTEEELIQHTLWPEVSKLYGHGNA